MENKTYLSVLICLLFMIHVFTSCDKFDLDFTTASRFDLDASSHELEIKTKQDEALISSISLNGEKIGISRPNENFTGILSLEKFKVHYLYGSITEIDGEWFNIKVDPPYTFKVSVSENHTDKERELIIRMLWRSAVNQAVIHQKAGSGNSPQTSFEEAKEMSDLFTSWKSGNTTRSGKTLKESSIIKSDNRAMMYVFNYNEGFTIISASKRMYPVLAYSETGSFTEDTDIPGLSAWLDFTKEEVRHSFVTAETEASESDEIRSYELLKEMFTGDKGTETRAKPEDPGTVECFNEIRNYVKVGPLLTTEWDQDEPWNLQSPMVDGVRAPAGCVPVAIGQAVNYHKTLTTKNIDWEKIAKGNDEEQAKFIRTIADEVKMSYHKEYTHPKINVPDFFNYRKRVKNFLNANGYTAEYIEPISSRPIVCPSIIEGFSKNFVGTTNWFGGHWWVLDGYESYEIWKGCGVVPIRSASADNEPLQIYSMLFFHFNWGWKGKNNGWFGVSESYLKYSKNLKRLQIIKN